MATEKRLIDANVAIERAKNSDKIVGSSIWETGEVVEFLEDCPIVDAVEVERFNALKSLVNGEWVDCKLVQEALGIDFATGLKIFKFSRTAEWNPAPLNGQKITTNFKLKNAVEHGRWVHPKGYVVSNGFLCSECGHEEASRRPINPRPGGCCLADENGNFFYPPQMNYCPNCGAKMDGDNIG